MSPGRSPTSGCARPPTNSSASSRSCRSAALLDLRAVAPLRHRRARADGHGALGVGAAQRRRVRRALPRMAADRAVVLAQERREIAAVVGARVAGRSVQPLAMPDEPLLGPGGAGGG